MAARVGKAFCDEKSQGIVAAFCLFFCPGSHVLKFFLKGPDFFQAVFCLRIVREEGNISHASSGVRFPDEKVREMFVHFIKSLVQIEKGRIVAGVIFQYVPGEVEAEKDIVRQE